MNMVKPFITDTNKTAIIVVLKLVALLDHLVAQLCWKSLNSYNSIAGETHVS